ncbi:MAG TPA: DUF3309 family protein [Dongiaceae bacterium]|nr:DUF3309 family protein [Dongiaceae bacterium]
MTVGSLVLLVLLLVLVGSLPTWTYSSGWGYRPTGVVGLALLITLILVLTGTI